MIAVDSSALLAILLREPGFEACIDCLERELEVLISAGTLAEALIVARRRNTANELSELVQDLGLVVVDVTAAEARRVAEAYAKWGKGAYPAGLNFGDCFAYAIAARHGCALLYVGGDFARTDVRSALTPGA